jgi:MoxR-like ATPase
VQVAAPLRGYLVELADATRKHPDLLLGMSPRATLSLQRAARARAAAAGRPYVIPDDIKTLAEPVLSHRLLVAPEAQLRGITATEVLDDVLATVRVPSTRLPE